MKLVKVFDLAGKPLAGVKTDNRSRNADGSLMHEHTHDRLHMTELTAVEIKRKDGAKWMYWRWKPIQGLQHDCGYSGAKMDGEHEHRFYVLADVP